MTDLWAGVGVVVTQPRNIFLADLCISNYPKSHGKKQRATKMTVNVREWDGKWKCHAARHKNHPRGSLDQLPCIVDRDGEDPSGMELNSYSDNP